MNDFTKEDLKNLLKWHNNSDTREYENTTKPLLDKVQSLIDNYCDHLWTDGSGNQIYCTKCHTYGGKR